MQALQQQVNMDEFFLRLKGAGKRALLLDYDGTLAPFHVRPDLATPYPGVRERLDAIMQAGHTHVVVVSGRWTRDLVPLLQLKHAPEIWGSHGWEQLKPDGAYEVARVNEDALKHLVEVDTWAKDIETKGGRCELKPGGLAIHWRGLEANQIADIRGLVLENWMLQEMHKSLVWHDFDGGIELRPPGRNKGFVVDVVLEGLGGDTVAAYLGDDFTDEDAFKVIRGRGIGVLVRPAFRETAADFWIRPPEELLDLLTRWDVMSRGGR